MQGLLQWCLQSAIITSVKAKNHYAVMRFGQMVRGSVYQHVPPGVIK